MATGNAETERKVVELARLRSTDVVLVVGHGPGIGLEAAALASREAIGVDPAQLMREVAGRRCAEFVRSGKVRLADGSAERTGLPAACVDVVLTVNNVQLWSDWAELRRVLRPGGRLLVSVHGKWLPGGQSALRDAVAEAGLTDVDVWTWEPPARRATAAVQLRALAPELD